MKRKTMRTLVLVLALLTSLHGCKSKSHTRETRQLRSEERVATGHTATIARDSERWQRVETDYHFVLERLDTLGHPRERLWGHLNHRGQEGQRLKDSLVVRDTIYIERLVERQSETSIRQEPPTRLWQSLWIPLVGGIVLGAAGWRRLSHRRR